MAFYQLEPFGDQWRQAGVIASVAANIVGRGEGEEPFQPQDFMPHFEDLPDGDKEMREKRVKLNEMMREAGERLQAHG